MPRMFPALVLPLTLASALIASPREAWSALHLRLLRSEPAADTTLATPPAAVRLWFSQRVEAKTTSVRVTGPGEAALDLAPVLVDTAAKGPVVAAIRGTVTPGRYAVAWRTMARDGHVIKGDFAFTVAGSSTGGTR